MHAIYYFHKTVPVDAPLETQVSYTMDAYSYYQSEMLDENNWDQPLCYVGPNGEYCDLSQDNGARWDLQTILESASCEERLNHMLCLAVHIMRHDLELNKIAPHLSKLFPEEGPMIAPYLSWHDFDDFFTSVYERLPQLLVACIDRFHDTRGFESRIEQNRAIMVRRLIETPRFPFIQPMSASFGYRLIDIDSFSVNAFRSPVKSGFLLVDIHV